MKAMYSFPMAVFLAAAAIVGASTGRADNFIYDISTPDAQFFFTVANIPASSVYPDPTPTLILTAGATYNFNINTTPGYHPVVITTNISDYPPTLAEYSGATPKMEVATEPITVTIPATNYVTPLYYICNVHGASIYGQIDIVPPPPPNQILSTKVTSTLVTLVSTGTENTWVLVPEYSSNLLSKAWTKLDDYVNTYENGTNTTTFSRLDPICGPNVFLRLRQSPPEP